MTELPKPQPSRWQLEVSPLLIISVLLMLVTMVLLGVTLLGTKLTSDRQTRLLRDSVTAQREVARNATVANFCALKLSKTATIDEFQKCVATTGVQLP